jgi:cytochrome c556
MHSSNDRRVGVVGIVVAIVAVAGVLSAQDDAKAVAQMHEHLSQVATFDYAVIRGDVEDAAAAAKAIAAGLSMTGLPPAAEKYLNEMRTAANAASAATDLKTAAAAAGSLQAACGNCHSGLGHAIRMGAADKVNGALSTRTRMREHAWSIEALAKGLQGPSDEHWKQGANSMKKARVIKVQLKDPQLTSEINAAEDEFRKIGDKARDARDQAARAAVYGEILNTCGHCHSLQGRVFGPAAPK